MMTAAITTPYGTEAGIISTMRAANASLEGSCGR